MSLSTRGCYLFVMRKLLYKLKRKWVDSSDLLPHYVFIFRVISRTKKVNQIYLSISTNCINDLISRNQVSFLNYSRSILANTEIVGIREILHKAVNQFKDALNLNISEDSEIDPQDFLEMVEKEEELLEALQEESDEEIDKAKMIKKAKNFETSFSWPFINAYVLQCMQANKYIPQTFFNQCKQN